MEELRDIKGLVEISDYSFYYLLALVLVTVFLAGWLIYRFFTDQKREKN